MELMTNSDIAKQLGKNGGLKTKEKYGTNHYTRIGKLSAQARKEKKKLQAVDKSSNTTDSLGNTGVDTK